MQISDNLTWLIVYVILRLLKRIKCGELSEFGLHFSTRFMFIFFWEGFAKRVNDFNAETKLELITSTNIMYCILAFIDIEIAIYVWPTESKYKVAHVKPVRSNGVEIFSIKISNEIIFVEHFVLCHCLILYK